MSDPSPELRDFSGHIAHDLNNILSALVGYGELLRNGLPASHPLRAYADDMMEATRRGGAFARSLGALGGRVAARPRTITTEELATTIATQCAQSGGANVKVMPGLNGHVLADPEVLAWAIAGAIQHLLPLLPDHVDVRLEPRREGLTLHLGRDFTPAEVAALFVCYQPLPPITKGGLGCAVLETVLKQAGGAATIESVAGSARLVMRLPSQRTSSGPRSWRGRTILVVSPDAARLAAAETALCSAGATVLTAEDDIIAARLARVYGGTIDALFCEPGSNALLGLATARHELPEDAALVTRSERKASESVALND